MALSEADIAAIRRRLAAPIGADATVQHAAARSDVEDLLDEVESLRTENALVTSAFDRFRARCAAAFRLRLPVRRPAVPS